MLGYMQAGLEKKISLLLDEKAKLVSKGVLLFTSSLLSGANNIIFTLLVGFVPFLWVCLFGYPYMCKVFPTMLGLNSVLVQSTGELRGKGHILGGGKRFMHSKGGNHFLFFCFLDWVQIRLFQMYYNLYCL